MKRGFTLIELLVAASIGLVLFSGGLAAYRGIGKKEAVKQAGISLQSDLRFIQQKALVGEKPAGCEGLLMGYRLTLNADLQGYQVVAECSLADAPMVEHDLDRDLLFASPLSGDVVFEVLRQGISGAQTITITNNDGEFSYQVTLEPSGVIRGEML